MQVSVTDAEAQLTDQARRAEQGEENVLTHHGHPAAQFVAVGPVPDKQSRQWLLESLQQSAAERITSGPSTVRNQDFLQGDDGTPI